MVWTPPDLSFTTLFIMQMSKNKSQFIINLVKLPNGFAFQSLVEPELPPPKKKNTKKGGTPNSGSKSMNRIARQLALDLQPPPQRLPPVPQAVQLYSPPHEVQVHEEIQVDIRRQKQLPELNIDWYDQTKIHDLQRSQFPEFFGQKASKAESIYLKYRNFIVSSYRKNPNQYLTKIACRRVLRGDVLTIMKIHSFLEKECLINFGVSKDGNYSFASSIFQKILNPQTKYPNPTQKMVDKDEEETYDPVDLTNLTITLVNKNFSKGNRVYCTKCGIICGLIWYIRKEDTADRVQNSLCCECYQQLPDKQSEFYVKSDIVKKAEALNSKQSSTHLRENKPIWNIEQNLKLLNFSSNPESKNWQQLKSQYDHKKSLDDILLQFMQFPISNFNEQSHHPAPVLSYPHDAYVDRLFGRFNQSQYGQQDELHEQVRPKEQVQENLYKEMKFQEQMHEVFKKLCKKYQERIKYQLIRQDALCRQLSDVKGLAEYRKKSLIAQKHIQLEQQLAPQIKKPQIPIIQENNKKIRKRSRRMNDQDSYSDDSSDSMSDEDEEEENEEIEGDNQNIYEGQCDGEEEESELNQMKGDICSQ